MTTTAQLIAELLVACENELEEAAYALMNAVDHCDDEGEITPAVQRAADAVVSRADDPSLGAVAELLAQYYVDLTRVFCDASETCPACFCCLENCADDGDCPGA
jgi:hypothetical protein